VPSPGRFLQLAPQQPGFAAMSRAEVDQLGLLSRFHTPIPPVVNAAHWQSWPAPPAPPAPPDLDLNHPEEQPALLPRDHPISKD
jgi:hypothetical protein